MPVTGHSITRARYGRARALVRCRRCGIVSVHPFPSEDELRLLYEEMADETYLEEKAVRQRMAERSLDWIESVSPKGRLLDIGCFAGFFLEVAKRRGWEVGGIEPSAWARRIAEETLGPCIFGGTLEKADLSSERFDVITLIDTLEHLTDPKSALSESHRLLKKSGVLYLSTPDVGSLAARLLGNRWWGYRMEHLVYFSWKTLPALLEELGFRIAAKRSYRRIFTVQSLLKRVAAMNPLLGAGFAPWVRLFRLGPREVNINFSDQIELIARKG